MVTHRNRNRLLLATVGLVAVGAILAGVVIQSRSETNDQAAEPVTSTTSPSGSTAPPPAPTTPSVSSNGSIPPEQVVVQPEVQVTIDAGDIAPVILKLAVTPVGTDEERIEQVRAARNELLAQLPAGSWTGTDDVGTLPYIALSLDAAGFEATRNSGVVSMINDDEELFVSASSLEPSSTVSPSSINSTATMGATAAWAAGWKGAGSTVAVIDTGVQTDHPYLMRGSTKKTIAEACFSSSCPLGVEMSPTSNPIVGAATPCSGAAGCDHGTHVAGIAVGGNGSSIPSGVAPEANLIAINVFYEYEVGSVPRISASTSSVNNALSWLYNKRALFPSLVSVNLSLGGSTKYTNYCDNSNSNSSTKDFIDLLLTVGITTVIASGNNGWENGVSAPGCISTAVTVGAVDGVPDATTYYSNDGPQVDLMAPGSNITSSILGSQMGLLSGTSMAAPAVAGAIAVLAGNGVQSSQWLTRLQRVAQTGVCVQASGYVIPTLRLDVALGITPSTTYGCGGSPFGVWDNSTAGPGTITVRGWAIDLGQLETVPLHVYVDGAFAHSGMAAELRSDVGAVYPFYGSNRGFSIPVTVNGGTRNVCVAMINQGPGSNVWLGCRSVVVPGGSPFGVVDAVMGRVGGVDVAGWVIDPDTALPAQAHVYAFRGDGSVAGAIAVTAGNFRSDLGVVFPAYGPNHGMSGSLSLPGGTYGVCVAAINVAGSGSNQWLPCRSVVVP